MGAGARGGPSVWALGERCVGSKAWVAGSVADEPKPIAGCSSKKKGNLA